MSCSASATGAEAGPADLQAAPLYTKFSTPVYSLSTAAAPGGRPTLNLVTYAAPMAISPRCFAVGLYRGTASHDNMMATRRGVLQVLQQQHMPLFQLLGKTSARSMDKLQALRDAGCTLVERFGLPTLQDVASVMELEVMAEPVDCGDHDVVLCRVTQWHNLEAEPKVLYTGALRSVGLM